jgi:ABC-2 type transport system ATP-binding protein
MTRTLAIETKRLTKKYDDFTAVSNLNLKIKTGTIFGLLGPNGAGKTTIILMLLGLTESTTGSCSVYGFNPMNEPLKVKRICGYLQEKVGLYENMTAGQNLKYIAKLNKIPPDIQNERIDEALEKVGLIKQSDIFVSKFSRGMKQRLGIANVLVKKPKIAFLDEPTQGIDPSGVQDILKILKEMNRDEKVTILISSHLIHHVQEICDQVGIMVNGKMKVRSKYSDFAWEKGGKWIIEAQARYITEQILQEIRNVPEVSDVKQFDDSLLIECNRDIRPRISKIIVNNNASLLGLRLRERSLDEIYKIYSE